MFNNYAAPPGFRWDINDQDDPFVENLEFDTYNADKLVEEFFEWVMHMKDHYKTNQLFVTMGEDFNYQNAKMFFQSTDKLIQHFNSKYPNITLLYSTPGLYVDSVAAYAARQNTTWSTKYDDMFPLC